MSQWVDDICSRCMEFLVSCNKPYKYIGSRCYNDVSLNYRRLLVNCSIVQKVGAGYHSSTSCYWDISNDNVVTAKWPNDKYRDPNARCTCHVTILGASL